MEVEVPRALALEMAVERHYVPNHQPSHRLSATSRANGPPVPPRAVGVLIGGGGVPPSSRLSLPKEEPKEEPNETSAQGAPRIRIGRAGCGFRCQRRDPPRRTRCLDRRPRRSLAEKQSAAATRPQAAPRMIDGHSSGRAMVATRWGPSASEASTSTPSPKKSSERAACATQVPAPWLIDPSL